MTITTRDGLIDALGNNATRIVIDKASLANAAAGQFFSLWAATGAPSAGATPGAAAIPTNATTGSLSFTNPTAPAKTYHGYQDIIGGNNLTNVEFHDRLAHMGGLSGIVTTAQTVGIDGTTFAADRRGDANYSDVQWWIEVYAALGATGVNATAAVTYDDGSTGNLAAVALGATPRAGRLYQLLSNSSGKWIRGVTSITLSATTGTAGSFGVTATRKRSAISAGLANQLVTANWAQLGFPSIADNACMSMIVPCSTTTTGAIRGGGKFIQG